MVTQVVQEPNGKPACAGLRPGDRPFHKYYLPIVEPNGVIGLAARRFAKKRTELLLRLVRSDDLLLQ